jgi:hypothetical protein
MNGPGRGRHGSLRRGWRTARLVRIFTAHESVRFRNPRGLRFGPDGDLYCVGRDEVARFDFETGAYAGAIVRLSDLFGQAVHFFD